MDTVSSGTVGGGRILYLTCFIPPLYKAIQAAVCTMPILKVAIIYLFWIETIQSFKEKLKKSYRLLKTHIIVHQKTQILFSDVFKDN